MNRRKKILNCHEEMTHTILSKVVSENGARVYPKIRIADVLDITASGLPNDQYSYALKAHFDFVIADKENCLSLPLNLMGLITRMIKLPMPTTYGRITFVNGWNYPC